MLFLHHLDDGKFVFGPTQGAKIASWTTTGTGIFGGDEKGFAQYDVKGYGIATFYFSNPAFGRNSCKVEAALTLQAECSIIQGIDSYATYHLVRH